MRATGSRSHRVLGVVLIFGLLAVPACTDSDEESAAEFCRVLVEEPSGSRWRNTDFIVFVDPQASEQAVEALRSEVERSDAVVESTWVSQEEAYDEFLETYDGQPDITEAVRAESLPASLRVRSVDRAPDAIGALAERFEDRAGVYRVVHHSGQPMSVIDWHVRPLTSPLAINSSALAAGRVELDISSVAPSEVRDHARALEALWAAPESASEPVQDAAVEAARQIAAFYDTKCG